jgi:alkanesulfonate monooxygenase SsuD/methylene tetrahydromethanopterin reductase-like flavin-dependent oxidoreductase (luciferase family)
MTGSRVRFGALLIPNAPWTTLLERALHLEELGIEVLWVDDHVVNPQRPSMSWMDSWSLLGALASRTTTIRLGTMVSNFVIRHPPVLARAALSVDSISGGRVELGVGAGYAESDHELAGRAPWPIEERLVRFEEGLEVLEGILSGQDWAVEGEHTRLRGARFRPVSPQVPRIPVTVAAHDRRSLRLAARFGDAWNSFGGYGLSSDGLYLITVERNRRLDEACAAIGRDAATLRRSLLAGNPSVTPDPVWASPAAFEDFVGRYHEAGINEFVFYYPPGMMYPAGEVADGMFERIAREVMPRWR